MLINSIERKQAHDNLNSNDKIIRHIFDYTYSLTLGEPKDNAFQIQDLKTRGLSVSIDRLLDQITRDNLIKDIEKNKHTFFCDYATYVNQISSIRHNGSSIFDVTMSPIKNNLAHADIKFTINTLPRSMLKKYRKELKDKFKRI